MRIRKTTNALVSNSLEKAAEAIRTALIDADCNEKSNEILNRKKLHDTITYLYQISKELNP